MSYRSTRPRLDALTTPERSSDAVSSTRRARAPRGALAFRHLWHAVLVTVAACSGGGEITPVTPPGPTARVVSVTVSPGTADVVVGGTPATFVATVTTEGSASTGVTWSSSNSAAVSLTTNGNSVTVTGIAASAQPVVINATSVADPSKVASALVTVQAQPAYSLALSSASATLGVGEQTQIDVTVTGVTGIVPPVTLTALGLPSGVTATFQPQPVTAGQSSRLTLLADSGATAVRALAITIRGDANPLTPRTATLPITVRGAASISVSVPNASLLIAGQTSQATAITRDARGAVLGRRAIAWRTSNASVATVSGSGLVTAVSAAGGTSAQAYIIAEADSVRDSVAVTVRPTTGVTTQVAISTSRGVVAPGSTVQLTATARDGSGNILPGLPVTWTVTDAARGTVSSTGVFTGGTQAGRDTVIATVQGITAKLMMCTSVAYVPGTLNVVQVVAGPLDCNGVTYFTFTSTGSVFANVSSTTSTASTRYPLGSTRGFNWALTSFGGDAQSLPILYGSGSWGSAVSGGGSYSFNITPSAPACGNIISSFNVTATIPLSTACPTFAPSGLPTGTYYGTELLLPPINVGEQFAVTVASTALVPLIRVLTSNGSQELASTLSMGGGTQTLTFTETAPNVVRRIQISTRVSGLSTGNLAITLTGPTIPAF